MLDVHLSRGWISCSLSLLEPADPLTPPEADLTQTWGQVQEEERGGGGGLGQEAVQRLEAWAVSCAFTPRVATL